MKSKSPTFDDFWKAYPLHRGKLDAEKAWARLSATDKQKALAALPRYREYLQQTGTNIKYPQGWLNGRRWEDEYDELSSVAGAACTAPAATKPCPPDTTAPTLFSDMETW